MPSDAEKVEENYLISGDASVCILRTSREGLLVFRQDIPIQQESGLRFFMYQNISIWANSWQFIINMKGNSKQRPVSVKGSSRQDTRTRWATETIQPIWHLVAAFQNLAQIRLLEIKSSTFKILHANMKDQREMLEFTNHCATLIQSNFKGYMQRKYYRQFLPIYRRFRSLLQAVIAGWRVRRIFRCKDVKAKCKKIKELSNAGQNREARIMKRNLTSEIVELQKRGKWVKKYQQQFQLKPNLKKQIKIINISKSQIPPDRIRPKQQPLNTSKPTNIQKVKDASQEQNIVKREDEIPIKALGKYVIPNDVMTEEPKPQVPLKKPFRKKKGQTSDLHVEKVPADSSAVQKKNIKAGNEKIAEADVSHLSIHLPVQEFENTLVLGKTVKFKQISLAVTPKNISTARPNMRSSDRKGISVTLSKHQCVAMEPEFQPSDSLEPLQEIMQVYKGVYQMKRQETWRSIQSLKMKTKY